MDAIARIPRIGSCPRARARAHADETMLELPRSFHLFPRNVFATHARNKSGAAPHANRNRRVFLRSYEKLILACPARENRALRVMRARLLVRSSLLPSSFTSRGRFSHERGYTHRKRCGEYLSCALAVDIRF